MSFPVMPQDTDRDTPEYTSLKAKYFRVNQCVKERSGATNCSVKGKAPATVMARRLPRPRHDACLLHCQRLYEPPCFQLLACMTAAA
jgi:hypothetical protein